MATEKLDWRDIDNWPTIEAIEDKIAEDGVKYTSSAWKILQCKDKLVLTPEMAERYNVIQKAHYRLTGYYPPDTIKGAMKTRAQAKQDLGPEIKDEVLDKAVQGGMAAKLAKMREGK